MTTRRLLIVAISLLFAAETIWTDGINASPDIPAPELSQLSLHDVLSVIDGDTVKLLIAGGEVPVRLIGVDTPETVHPQTPVEAYGKQASLFLTNLLQGETVYLQHGAGGPAKDQFGRTLAYLYRVPDGLFINLEIVRQGYGHAYTEYPFEYMELFRHYETKAREAQKGLWSPQAGQDSIALTVVNASLQQVLQQLCQSHSFRFQLRNVRADATITCSVQGTLSQIVSGLAAAADCKAHNEGGIWHILGSADTQEVSEPAQQQQQTQPQYTPPADPTVYRTRTGSKYHNAGCQYLRLSSIAIYLSEARRQGYTACSRCW